MIASAVRFGTHCLVHARRRCFQVQGWICTRWRRTAERFFWTRHFAGIPHGVIPAVVKNAVLIKGAWVLGDEGSVTDSSGYLLSAVAPRVGFLEGWAHPVMKRTRPWSEARGEACAVLLSGGHASNYYHWLFEILPRVVFLEQQSVDLRETVVLAPVQFSFQQESLTLLGARRIRPLAPNQAFKVEKLWCTPPAFSANLPFEQSGRWLREQLLREVPAGKSRRVLLKRKQGKRSIVNFDELAEKLTPLGFEVIAAERLSFAEQLELFASADCVVAAHGAGLANIVFCRPGTKIVEIISEDYLSHLYRDIARAGQLDYAAVVAKAVGRPWELREGSKQLLVHPDRIVAALRGGSVAVAQG